MELMEAIKGRRSVRKFKPDPIPKEDLEEIIQAGLCAPSAQNLQPWYFVALTKKEDLSYLFSELGTTAFSHRKELEARFKNNPEVVEETMEFKEIHTTNASCTIACHCGPNTLGILFETE